MTSRQAAWVEKVCWIVGSFVETTRAPVSEVPVGREPVRAPLLDRLKPASNVTVVWDPAHVEDAIAAIVADTDAAFDPEELWPAHEWDGWEEPLPLKNLYVGAAGVIWALDALRRGGHAETSLDLAAAAVRTLELERAAPGFTADDH